MEPLHDVPMAPAPEPFTAKNVATTAPTLSAGVPAPPSIKQEGEEGLALSTPPHKALARVRAAQASSMDGSTSASDDVSSLASDHAGSADDDDDDDDEQDDPEDDDASDVLSVADGTKFGLKDGEGRIMLGPTYQADVPDAPEGLAASAATTQGMDGGCMYCGGAC
jgi:hypothetical protein